MELGKLECFVAVAEELHFGRAASRVHLTVSPVSRAIRDLERELGGELFVRRYRQVELTPFGRELLPLAKQVLQAATALTTAARSMAEQTATLTVRLGVSQLCPPVAADLVQALLADGPAKPSVEVTFGPAAELLPELERGELDLALVQLPIGRSRLSTMVLVKLVTWVIMRTDDPMAERQELWLQDLAGRQLIIGAPRVEPVAMETMIANLKASGVTDIVQLPEFDHVKLAAFLRYRGGLALTLHPSTGGSARIFDDKAFHLVPLRDRGFRFTLGAAWRTADATEKRAVREAVHQLRAKWQEPHFL